MPFASVVLRDVSKSYGPNTVLAGVNFTLGPRTRTGVVGPNGTGKTTLLRLVAGREQPDGGTITHTPPTAVVGFLPQEPDRRPDESVIDFVARRTGVHDATAALEGAADAMAGDEPGAADRYDTALARYLDSGAADFEARFEEVLTRVGLDGAVRSQMMATLSGGQAARASLASVLLSRFDLLLLDEPTNDLDFAGLALLEDFVNSSDSGMLLVSHDRAFLARTTTSVLELDAHDHTATEFRGGYTAYLEERATMRRQAEERYGEYTTKRETLVERGRSQRQWAQQGISKQKKRPKDNDKAQRDFFANRTEKQAAKVRITEKALDRLDTVEKPWEAWRLQMELPTAARAGDVVAALRAATVRRGDFTLGPLDLEIGWSERVAIVGPNGSGKTTLLNALLGRLPLTSGSAYLGPSVVVGELDQVRRTFSATDTTVIDVFAAQSGLLVGEARTLLAKFALGAEQVLRSPRSLSPGERTRAVLALLMARQTNLLVLDEPTNHLDVEAIEQLEQALSTYDGTVLLVTHDRRMLDAVEISRTVDLGSTTS